MEVTHLSKTYNVRRLQEDDIEQICTLCSGNPQYYRYHPPAATADSIREDMRALPSGREPQDKYYVGYFAGDGTLLAVMDLILGYPQEWTAFIGFFMVSAARQGTGRGSAGSPCPRPAAVLYSPARADMRLLRRPAQNPAPSPDVQQIP